MPIEGEPFDGTVLVREGRITGLGPDLEIPADRPVIDADGAWLLPGFIDAHVHLGVDEEGEGWAGDDTNEMTDPVMAAARALKQNTDLPAKDIAEKALHIAADICVYTNHNVIVEDV